MPAMFKQWRNLINDFLLVLGKDDSIIQNENK